MKSRAFASGSALVLASFAVMSLFTAQPASAGLFDFLKPKPKYYPPPPGYQPPGYQPPGYQPGYQPPGYKPPGYQPGYFPPPPGQQPIDLLPPGQGGNQPQQPADGPLTEAEAAIGEFRDQPLYKLPFYMSKTEWTAQDEAEFGSFVAQIGKAIKEDKCSSVKTCMRSEEANRFRKYDPPTLVLYSDCADFPYFLRAYFAYHKGLPFGYVNDIEMNAKPFSSIANRDDDLPLARLDNSPYGNYIVSRGGSAAAKEPGKEPNLIKYLERLYDNVSTRTLRVGPFSPKYDLFDLYPVKIDRNGIGPGTVVLSTGHAMIVWNVTNKGVVQGIDAHPDGSVSHKEVKPSTLDRSRPDHGLGFFRFRPIRLEGAQKYSNGAYYGGKIVTKTDAELFAAGLYSLEQWYGPNSNIAPGSQVDPNAWTNGFKKPGFFDFLAERMRDSNVVIKADEEVGDQLQGLCSELKQRVKDVDAALAGESPMNKNPHPNELPENIFSAERPWEDFSTPGRDGRIKASAQDIIKSAVNLYRQAKAGHKNIKFEGSAEDFVKSIREKLSAMNDSCSIRYVNSNGDKVKVKFTRAVTRLSKMSFDPYHCPEKRWGASGEELQTCKDTDSGDKWYEAQQVMRNTVGKLVPGGEALVIRSDRPITLSMLADSSLIDRPESAAVNLGTATAPVTNLDENFKSDKFLELLKK